MGARPLRRLAAAVIVGVMLTSTPGAGLVRAADCLRPPVDAPVTDAFRPPPCPWCAGNRGLEYAPAAGTPVRAAAAGVVTFAGSVAGTLYVVVEHVDGLRATYGRLSGIDVRLGDRVPAGAVVGRSGDGLFFGVRRGEDYVDPAPLLAEPVGRPRLVPTDGTRPRPAPPPEWRCPPPGPSP